MNKESKSISLKIVFIIIFFILFLISANKINYLRQLELEMKTKRNLLLSIISNEEIIKKEREEIKRKKMQVKDIFKIKNNIEFLNKITEILNDNDIKVTSLKPLEDEQMNNIKKLRINIELELSFPKLIKLIENFEFIGQYICIEKMYIKQEQLDENLKLKLELSALYMNN
jgi:hypothetical protein